ncbi:MAG: ParB/RepB/Spo0J family partition protein [Parachlamydiales bacterium]|nr:ParB/RepB/Spo0J family partition protein [Parachlamydiales bacterium]
MTDILIEIPIDQIVTNPFQPRRVFLKAEIDELAQSILSLGLLHPPVVRQLGTDSYELIAGERRWRAAQIAGLKLIPVVVHEADDDFSAHAALMENLQRVDLNPIETAEALKALMHKFHLKQEELAEKIGKKRSTVANYLRLLTLPTSIRDSVALGVITMGHAKVLLSIENEQERGHLYHDIITGSLTVRQTENKAQKITKRVSSGMKSREHLSHIINTLQNLLGTKVDIEEKKEGGRLCIDYYSLDDLDRLLEHLGVTENI